MATTHPNIALTDEERAYIETAAELFVEGHGAGKARAIAQRILDMTGGPEPHKVPRYAFDFAERIVVSRLVADGCVRQEPSGYVLHLMPVAPEVDHVPDGYVVDTVSFLVPKGA